MTIATSPTGLPTCVAPATTTSASLYLHRVSQHDLWLSTTGRDEDARRVSRRDVDRAANPDTATLDATARAYRAALDTAEQWLAAASRAAAGGPRVLGPLLEDLRETRESARRAELIDDITGYVGVHVTRPNGESRVRWPEGACLSAGLDRTSRYWPREDDMRIGPADGLTAQEAERADYDV